MQCWYLRAICTCKMSMRSPITCNKKHLKCLNHQMELVWLQVPLQQSTVTSLSVIKKMLPSTNLLSHLQPLIIKLGDQSQLVTHWTMPLIQSLRCWTPHKSKVVSCFLTSFWAEPLKLLRQTILAALVKLTQEAITHLQPIKLCLPTTDICDNYIKITS